MNWLRILLIGEIIARPCETSQVVNNIYIDLSGLSVAGLLLLAMFVIVLVLLVRWIIAEELKRR